MCKISLFSVIRQAINGSYSWKHHHHKHSNVMLKWVGSKGNLRLLQHTPTPSFIRSKKVVILLLPLFCWSSSCPLIPLLNCFLPSLCDYPFIRLFLLCTLSLRSVGISVYPVDVQLLLLKTWDVIFDNLLHSLGLLKIKESLRDP